MTDRYAPPSSRVEDIPLPRKRTGWFKLLLIVAVSSALAITLSWILAPALAGKFVSAVLPSSQEFGFTILLLSDMILSFAAFLLGCWLAARSAHGRSIAAALGVAAVGWLCYFVEAGGVSGMLKSQYPFWYEFFPIHFSAAALAAYLASRRGTRSQP